MSSSFKFAWISKHSKNCFTVGAMIGPEIGVPSLYTCAVHSNNAIEFLIGKSFHCFSFIHCRMKKKWWRSKWQQCILCFKIVVSFVSYWSCIWFFDEPFSTFCMLSSFWLMLNTVFFLSQTFLTKYELLTPMKIDILTDVPKINSII